MHPVEVFISFSAVTLTIPHTAPLSESEPGPTPTVDPYFGMVFHSLRPSQPLPRSSVQFHLRFASALSVGPSIAAKSHAVCHCGAPQRMAAFCLRLRR